MEEELRGCEEEHTENRRASHLSGGEKKLLVANEGVCKKEEHGSLIPRTCDVDRALWTDIGDRNIWMDRQRWMRVERNAKCGMRNAERIRRVVSNEREERIREERGKEKRKCGVAGDGRGSESESGRGCKIKGYLGGIDRGGKVNTPVNIAGRVDGIRKATATDSCLFPSPSFSLPPSPPSLDLFRPWPSPSSFRSRSFLPA